MPVDLPPTGPQVVSMTMSTTTKTTKHPRPRVQIGPGSTGLLMTPVQFDALLPKQFQRGYRYEIVNGVLIVSPQPGAGERRPNDYLGSLLDHYREDHPQGSVIDETLWEHT